MSSSSSQHRTTARAWFVLLLALVLGQLLWTTGSEWFLPPVGAAVGVLVLGLAARARTEGLHASLVQPHRTTVGDEVEGLLTLSNRASRPTSELRVTVQTAGYDELTVSVGRLLPGDQVALSVRRTALARASASEHLVQVRSLPLLGLRAATRTLVLPTSLFVHPRLPAMPRPPMTPSRADPSASPVRLPGHDVSGVREWRSGDDRSGVHWRSTARTGHPVLLERERDTVARLHVALVGEDAAEGFEPALASAASLCDAALRAGHEVTVVAWHTSGPVLGPPGPRENLLDWWSTVHDGVLPEPADFARTTLAGFGPGDLVVLGPPQMRGPWFSAAVSALAGSPLRLHHRAGAA